ncbi:MAG: helix-turn-helix transcriptional regulator [Salinarimonas sp.]|nr:helix-turn-helix transcriptional regulator [Salinarimonas sp.]
MRNDRNAFTTIDSRIAARLRELRHARNLSLEQLEAASGVSRSTLSRLEKAQTSATAEVLGRLCSVFGLPVSRLLQEVENAPSPHVPHDAQSIWHDPATGMVRRVISPPAEGFTGEVIGCTLPAGTIIAYPAPPRPGLEHHLVLQVGALHVTLEDDEHRLGPGDCLRYRLIGSSRFETPPDHGATYLLFML